MALEPWTKASHAYFKKRFDETWQAFSHLWPEGEPKPRSIDAKIVATNYLLGMRAHQQLMKLAKLYGKRTTQKPNRVEGVPGDLRERR